MKAGDKVKVVDPLHFRVGQIGTIEAAPDTRVVYVCFPTLDRNFFYCCEWIDTSKLKIHEDDGKEVQ